MDDNRIGEIVQKVFAKARGECISQKKNALAKHIAHQIQEHHGYISYRTLERAYDRHILEDSTVSERNAESIDLFCQYLGYENYQDFIQKETRAKGAPQEEPPTDPNTKKTNVTFYLLAAIFVVVLMLVILGAWPFGNNTAKKETTANCMTWADSLYVPISCDIAPLSTYGTPVVPIDPIKMKNFKKVKVNMATRFFSEHTNEPRFWYYKNKQGEIEYFTAPGLHPITGKTLDEITEYIIQKYVPVHRDRPDSFVEER